MTSQSCESDLGASVQQYNYSRISVKGMGRPRAGAWNKILSLTQ